MQTNETQRVFEGTESRSLLFAQGFCDALDHGDTILSFVQNHPQDPSQELRPEFLYSEWIQQATSGANLTLDVGLDDETRGFLRSYLEGFNEGLSRKASGKLDLSGLLTWQKWLACLLQGEPMESWLKQFGQTAEIKENNPAPRWKDSVFALAQMPIIEAILYAPSDSWAVEWRANGAWQSFIIQETWQVPKQTSVTGIRVAGQPFFLQAVTEIYSYAILPQAANESALIGLDAEKDALITTLASQLDPSERFRQGLPLDPFFAMEPSQRWRHQWHLLGYDRSLSTLRHLLFAKTLDQACLALETWDACPALILIQSAPMQTAFLVRPANEPLTMTNLRFAQAQVTRTSLSMRQQYRFRSTLPQTQPPNPFGAPSQELLAEMKQWVDGPLRFSLDPNTRKALEQQLNSPDSSSPFLLFLWRELAAAVLQDIPSEQLRFNPDSCVSLILKRVRRQAYDPEQRSQALPQALIAALSRALSATVNAAATPGEWPAFFDSIGQAKYGDFVSDQQRITKVTLPL
jgi:hypothetical protein